MNILWFSAGVSSAMIAYLCQKELDGIIYQHIEDQHPDSLRFLHDVEDFAGKKIEIEYSPYKDVETVCRYYNAICIPGAPAQCTKILKQAERRKWEYENPGEHTYFWRLDYNERNRMEGFIAGMPHANHRFPLIERDLTKHDVHAMAVSLGLHRPIMYEMGYHNNNCIGCVRGGMGYWNKIRRDFPEVFAKRARMERDIGHSCIKGIYLDELDSDAGRHEPPIDIECGMYCLLNL
ncbi:MAG: phosphoadenosine phosphosulfate reductase [Lentisphaeria bacterium]|nr:phosphoadenosine phosphosulfate reductase [Lentisphaeria bacterium]